MSERPPSDALSAMVNHYRINAKVYASPRVCGAWRINPTGMHGISFHLIASGFCWFHQREPEAPIRLVAGDLVFLSRDVWHVLSPDERLEGTDTWLSDSSDGRATELICGSIELGNPHAAQLLAGLPDVLRISGADDDNAEKVRALGRLMAAETSEAAGGWQIVLDRLADILIMLVLRHAMDRGLAGSGMLAALADPSLYRALGAMHRAPGHDWTLETLAAEAAMSRTAFAQRFAATMGKTPIAYLSEWRMQLAEQQLRDQRLSVAQIADRLGYATEAAFRRAFKRIRGVAPGAIRRAAHTTRTSCASAAQEIR